MRIRYDQWNFGAFVSIKGTFFHAVAWIGAITHFIGIIVWIRSQIGGVTKTGQTFREKKKKTIIDYQLNYQRLNFKLIIIIYFTYLYILLHRQSQS